MMRPPVKAVIPDLIACLEDGTHYVRYEAAVALSTMGPDAKAAVPLLLKLTKDPYPKVREAAVAALKKIDPEAADLQADKKTSRQGDKETQGQEGRRRG
jgi:HEAT repeat protein